MADQNVIDNEAKHRFELAEGGSTAIASYRIEGDTISFTHTVVPEEIEGQGVGSRLVRGALDQVREKGLRVVPLCYFVKGYIERHPEYQDILA